MVAAALRILFYYSGKKACWVPLGIMTAPAGNVCGDGMI